MSKELQEPLKDLSQVVAASPIQKFLTSSLASSHAELLALRLHGGVPINVRQLFETAKNVSLYSWFVYRFHQVAELIGFAALEMALRHRAGYVEFDGDRPAPPTLSKLLRRAQKENWIENARFPSLSARAFERARENIFFEEMAVGSPDEQRELRTPTGADVDQALSELDIVRGLVESAPKIRNTLAHGSSVLSPRSIKTLLTISETINQLFEEPPP